uniref:ATP-dependent RNA helicase n=1 Tax=Lotharella oceanica TaxID=641309 RepID=A0A7S2XFB3_9EUKA|mmetsp:Transcript_36942/g.68188  ORF Transcript_36942/g.68188 Transcript_36942/m.68188 type:complete len:348 (+) Transcript_36942:2-1045(+)
MGLIGVERDWPFRPRLPAPDILVCTPKMLRQFVRDLDLFAGIETLVIDEADMLLDRGSYENDINEILVAFKRATRTMATNVPTQFVLSAATIPNMGLKSVDRSIEKRFPNAEHVRAKLMHKHHPSTQQDFVKTTKDFDDKVSKVLESLEKHSKDNPKTIVFANTAKDAQRFADALMDVYEHPDLIFPYHKDIPADERDSVLGLFRKTPNGVLVCTDLGARGLDIPDVRHVIQAQFATNVVQHLHRIGRATRAGRAGRSTNLYDEANEDLVDAILAAGEGNLDHSFSRRRGFRKTVKRYGKDFYKFDRPRPDGHSRSQGGSGSRSARGGGKAAGRPSPDGAPAAGDQA